VQQVKTHLVVVILPFPETQASKSANKILVGVRMLAVKTCLISGTLDLFTVKSVVIVCIPQQLVCPNKLPSAVQIHPPLLHALRGLATTPVLPSVLRVKSIIYARLFLIGLEKLMAAL